MNKGIAMSNIKFNVAVVIVTYNRLEKLKKTLKSYAEQTLKPEHVIVVNNNSTDDTRCFLECWSQNDEGYDKHVINLSENVGGSGGFYEGEKYALELEDVNWIMIADDDAYPARDYIYGMANYLLKLDNSNNIAVICGKVIQENDYVNIHRSYLKSKWNWNFHKCIPREDYNKKIIYPDFVSYVGILVNKNVLEKAGLVDRELFIWNDDTEHSYRMRKHGMFICLPQYDIYHDVAAENNNLSWKNYYDYRNKTSFFIKHFRLQSVFIVSLIFLKSLLSPLKGKSFTEFKLRLVAIKDGIVGNMGKDEIYKPGWKP